MKAIILCAGVGSRLGKPYPKCLNNLSYGERIIERQVRILRKHKIDEIIAVVGFKKELIMEQMHSICYIYNPIFYLTNTAKSLLYGIKYLNDDVIWLNGDVVFEESILAGLLASGSKNVIAVNSNKCGEEEVKYKLNKENKLINISKKLSDADGEAVGINMISKENLNIFKEKLEQCDDNDYFEKAIELLIEDGVVFEPYNTGNDKCIEVDFQEDWEVALDIFK